ncbi:signal peptide peptidase SppA [Candidatus Dojkabacteria bacterium]|nr:signal peptide peptidase SppA [Candidatus Dojkabacteria bacterium]
MDKEKESKSLNAGESVEVEKSTTSSNQSGTVNASIPVSSEAPKKSNKGCLIVGGIGCGLLLLIGGAFIAFIVLLASASGDLSTSANENVLYEGSEDKIAVINIEGVIGMDDSSSLFSSSGVTPDRVESELNMALEDDSVKAIILNMNTPGGEVVASDLIYRAVSEASEKKPVITWISSMGASGGYYIAAGSDKIVAHPASLTGSIGVIMELQSMDGLYDKLGIESKVYTSGNFKDSNVVFNQDDKAAEGDEIFQEIVDESYEQFVNAIVDGRDMDRDTVYELADGRIYTGTQAYDNGLVDEVGTMEDAIAVAEDLAGSDGMTVFEYTYSGFWGSMYSYKAAIFDKLGIITDEESYGVNLYYVLSV